MKKDTLNHTLLDRYPEIMEEGLDLDIPASNFYQQYFVPYIEKKIKERDAAKVKDCFLYIEELLSGEEEEVTLGEDMLLFLYEDKADLRNLPLGKLSSEYFQDWLAIRN